MSGHSHGHPGATHRWRLRTAFVLVAGFFVVELATGLLGWPDGAGAAVIVNVAVDPTKPVTTGMTRRRPARSNGAKNRRDAGWSC